MLRGITFARRTHEGNSFTSNSSRLIIVCGIVGIVYFEAGRAVTLRELSAMGDSIIHRGPDDGGFHVDGNVGVGMRRLSIIDVTGGHQPIHTPDGRFVIVFNGEVYNFKEERALLEQAGYTFVTQSDTEVVLALFAHYGPSSFDRMNGMFGLAIWDRVNRELIVARDRIGIKPLYYYQDSKKLIFASEIKAILTHPEVQRELDLEGFSAYLRYGFTPAPYTLFRRIRKLPPAHYMRVKESNISETRYWHLSYCDKYAQSEGELAEELYALLGDSVRHQMIADVPLGAFLSGGFDSSGIVHLMSQFASEPVNSYSIGFGEGFGNYNELAAAGRFAKDYRTSHHEIVVSPDIADLIPTLVKALDEPVADSSFLVTYLVAQLARESVTVILSGVGGDELFGGYRRYLNVSLARYMKFLPRTLQRNALLPLLKILPVDRNSRILNVARLGRMYLSAAELPVHEQYGKYSRVFDDSFARELSPGLAGVPDYYEELFAECDSGELLDKMMYFDLKMSLPEQLLMLTDKMTMAVSLEARVPFLDHRVVEFAARLPTSMKIRGFKLRHLQKLAFRGKLPSYVYEQRKKGFGAPVGVWIRNELRGMVEELLGESQLRMQGIFQPRCIANLVRDHYSQRADHTDQLLALIVFQLWARSYGISRS